MAANNNVNAVFYESRQHCCKNNEAMGAYRSFEDRINHGKKGLTSGSAIKRWVAVASFLIFLLPPTAAASAAPSAYAILPAAQANAPVSKHQHYMNSNNAQSPLLKGKESLKSGFNRDLKAFVRIVSKTVSDPDTLNWGRLKAIEKKLSCDARKIDSASQYPTLHAVEKLKKFKATKHARSGFSMRSFIRRPDVRKLIGDF